MRSVLCKLGIHFVDKKRYFVNYRTHNGQVTSRSAFCKRCDRKLYLVDKDGDRVRK